MTTNDSIVLCMTGSSIPCTKCGTKLTKSHIKLLPTSTTIVLRPFVRDY